MKTTSKKCQQEVSQQEASGTLCAPCAPCAPYVAPYVATYAAPYSSKRCQQEVSGTLFRTLDAV